MDIDRLKHSIGVARKIVEIGKEYSLNEADLQKLYILDYNHDIGYEFSEDKLEHNIIDGNLLKDNGYEYWKEVYYHGNTNTEYESLFLKILNMADMQIDKYGNDVGCEKRLADIENRDGISSIQYLNSKAIVAKVGGKYGERN